MTKKERKIATFDKTMTEEEVEKEKRKPTALGESLRNADRQYEERRRKK